MKELELNIKNFVQVITKLKERPALFLAFEKNSYDVRKYYLQGFMDSLEFFGYIDLQYDFVLWLGNYYGLSRNKVSWIVAIDIETEGLPEQERIDILMNLLLDFLNGYTKMK